MCNTSFCGIFTVESIYSNIFMIHGHLHGQKVNSKVNNLKVWFFS